MIRIPTSAEVWAVLHARHKNDLQVYGSFSDPTGTWMGGPGTRGHMNTIYGLRGSDYPLMEAETTWEIHPEKQYERINEQHQFWLCISKEPA